MKQGTYQKLIHVCGLLFLVILMHAASVRAPPPSDGNPQRGPQRCNGNSIPCRDDYNPDYNYIVKLKAGIDIDAFDRRNGNPSMGKGGRRLNGRAMNGVAGKFTYGQWRQARQDPDVEAVEPDYNATATSWGLDRIDQRDLPLDGSLGNFLGTGETSGGDPVHVYIVDTGVELTHEQFEGRFKIYNEDGTLDRTQHYSVFGAADNTADRWSQDCDGHGTHCAGTALGVETGVAWKAVVHNIRVLDCRGSGYYSGIAEALNWIAANKKDPAVVSMSLGGPKSTSLNQAVEDLVASGVAVVVAAGNSDDDACQYSPASAPSAITVAATDSTDTRAYFSNYGTCVDIFAPGVSIYSSTPSNSYASWSGTSMACPHVAGAAAVLQGGNPSASPAQILAQFSALATKDKVSDSANTVNHLLFIGNEGVCSPNPCVYGSCTSVDSSSYTCACDAGYEGDDCDQNIDDCTGVDCNEGSSQGSCVDDVNGYWCNCADGFDGDDCGDVDYCHNNNNCLNGGSCVNGASGYTCLCAGTGYTGDTCQTPSCQSGWSESSGNCYLFVNQRSGMRQPQAEAYCTNLGADLVSILSSTENDYVRNLVSAKRTSYVWIGLEKQQGSWAWSDGTTYDNWKGEPNNQRNNRDCVGLSGSSWYALRCRERNNFVCKYVL